MAWDATPSGVAIVEVAAGDGKTTIPFYADPGETLAFYVKRTDPVTNGDAWRVSVEASLDGNEPWSDPPIRNRRFKPTQLVASFLLTGYPAYQVTIQNTDDDPQDHVGADVVRRGNGVNL